MVYRQKKEENVIIKEWLILKFVKTFEINISGDAWIFTGQEGDYPKSNQ